MTVLKRGHQTHLKAPLEARASRLVELAHPRGRRYGCVMEGVDETSVEAAPHVAPGATLDPSLREVFEGATSAWSRGDLVAYLAVMAYPKNVERRDHFIESVKAWAERVAKAGRPMLPRDIDRRMNRVREIIMKRWPAADLATRHLLKPGGVILTTTNQPVETATTHRFAVATTNDDTPNNFYRDVWTPCKPVLHLMIAFGNHAPGFMPEGKYGIDDLIARPGWLRPALENAEALRLAIDLCDAIPVSDDDMIQLLAK